MTALLRATCALSSLALLALLPLLSGGARADELTVGVFLPQATFATNAERSAWAQDLAATLEAATAGEHTFVARTFARRADVVDFVQARRIDVLVTDGLLLVDTPAEAIAHSAAAPAATLYGAPGVTLTQLAGQVVAVVEAGADDLGFYANTALAGEVSASTYFGELRRAKDAGAALGAVHTGAARAAFAPAGHPAAAGLVVLAQGGAMPLAVVAITNPARVDEALRVRLLAALTAGAGTTGGLGAWQPGPGEVLTRARTLARALPQVLTAMPLLAARPDDRLAPPPLRLRAAGRLEPPKGAPAVSVAPTLEEDP